eukprot:209563-Heterocapsa_arctica.AAC.1
MKPLFCTAAIVLAPLLFPFIYRQGFLGSWPYLAIPLSPGRLHDMAWVCCKGGPPLLCSGTSLPYLPDGRGHRVPPI